MYKESPAAKQRYGFATWWPGALDRIGVSPSGKDLRQVDYYKDPVAYLYTALGEDSTATLDAIAEALGQSGSLDVGALAKNFNVHLGDNGTLSPYGGGYTAPALRWQRIGLAAHHLYGSARLGVAGYWPQQYSALWDYTNHLTDTIRLLQRLPWYSGSGNGYANAYTTGMWTAAGGTGSSSTYNGLSGVALATHVLGQVQYELSNHLGNVQVTVSDKRYVRRDGKGKVAGYSASLPAVYDYYPFGMPMKERTLRDTVSQTVYMTQLVQVPNVVSVQNAFGNSAGLSGYGGAQIIANGSLALQVQGQGGGVQKVLTGLTPNVAVTLTVSLLYTASHISIAALGGSGSGGPLLGSVMANGSGSYTLTFTPVGSVATVVVSSMVSFAGGTTVLMRVGGVSYSQQSGYTNVPQLVAVSSKGDDRYEFGFNGQEKTNEVAGQGNHNTALFWEYDTRMARRWNLDPKPHIGMSEYSVFGGNPIYNSDPSGDYFTEAEGSNGLKKLEMVKIKANKRLDEYRTELAKVPPNSKRADELHTLIDGTQASLDKISSMEKSDIEFHLTNGGEATKWNSDKKRVEIGTTGCGANNNPDYLGPFPHELEHGYQYLTGDLAGYSGNATNPLYDLSDEYKAVFQSTFLADKSDFTNWHTGDGSYEKYKSTETGPNSGHPYLRNKTAAISVNTAAAVYLQNDNSSRFALFIKIEVQKNPKATVADAIKSFNDYNVRTGSKDRILAGEDALKNR